MSEITKDEPLAFRARPADFSSFVGQKSLFNKGSLLERILESGKLSTSLILTGPPGVGKSTLAFLLASKLNSEIRSINATTSSVSEIREIIKLAQGKSDGLILLIDEIHRFNKSQQDALLKASEEGVVKIIGTTTENPFFAVNKALLSRSSVLQFESLTPTDIRLLLEEVTKKFYPTKHFEAEVLDLLSIDCSGDARRALNFLEVLALDKESIKLDDLKKVLSAKSLLFDKDGDQHYNLISALIKSIRGSDADASLLYLASAIDSGMDPLYIARRLIVLASEDIGLADPSALTSALNAERVVEIVGLPEARYALAQSTLHLALAYKSNSVTLALAKATSLVEGRSLSIPYHLRDSHYSGASDLGVKGYVYPHDNQDAIAPQDYWPSNIKRKELYKPNPRGNEIKISELLEKIKRRLNLI